MLRPPGGGQLNHHRLTHGVRRVQDRLALGLGVLHSDRSATVVSMLGNNARRAPGYWIQLTLAMGIATLGLVLGSTAVVIGAMLVSPLMGPIIELGMGFAVGSSLLVMRAAFRVSLSIVVVVSGAAFITLALPFHEVTSEISTRTAPTALDLLVAAFCALTASYTTVRPGSDSASAAAGTAIGIALVPPLCVIGFGLGTFSSKTAGGASLLFTANLSAILVLSVFSFFALGYNQVDAAVLEHDFIEPATTRSDRLAYRIHQAIHRLFGSRYGGVMRIMVPATFLALVYVPLGQALTDVTWEVRTRDAVQRIVRDEDPHAMQTALTVDRSALSIRLLVIGSSDRARVLEDSLIARVARAVGVTPTVSVVAVPDARMLREAAVAEARAPVATPARPGVRIRENAATALRNQFPPEAGALLDWAVALDVTDTNRFTVHHLGPALGPAGTALLARALETSMGSPVTVADVALSGEWYAARAGRTSSWLDSTRNILNTVVDARRAFACVEGPAVAAPRTTAASRRVLASLQQSPIARAGRLRLSHGPAWRVRVAVDGCDAGAPGDSRSKDAQTPD
jgi:uncharacterized hydrophobic protein (TIGR00271 family)